MKRLKAMLKWRPKQADLERLMIVCAAVLVVVLAVRGGAQRQEEQASVVPEVALTSTATVPETEMQSTVCWYRDGDGYLVPVTRQIPKQDGVAKATLALMVSSGENDLAAARMGLTTVIPEGTTFDVDISRGKARVDMSREALDCATAEQELLMVQGTAAALCCFQTVDEVTFLFDGQKRSRLTHGTDVSGVFTAQSVNVESVAAMAQSDYAKQVQLYFPSASGRLLVPVTRTVYSQADLSTAMLELAKGPRPDSGLERPIPGSCGVRSVTVKDGVATVDFTSSFLDAMQGEDSRQALRAILFTASQFPGVKRVNLMVEGKPYKPEPDSEATFLNEASEVMSQYPGVVEID